MSDEMSKGEKIYTAVMLSLGGVAMLFLSWFVVFAEFGWFQ